MSIYICDYSRLGDGTDSPMSETRLKEVRDRYRLRRADRFSLMALAGVMALDIPTPASVALLTVSAFGPHRTTFATLDDILDYPEDQVMAAKFSHSLHNAAASYIAATLGITGPAFALTGFEDAWFETLNLAETLLDSAIVEYVLVSGTEERALLTETAATMFPEHFNVMREGVITMLIGKNQQESRFGKLIIKPEEESDDCPLYYFGAGEGAILRIEESNPQAEIILSPLRAMKIGGGGGI